MGIYREQSLKIRIEKGTVKTVPFLRANTVRPYNHK